jgi:hypothetical protein
MLVRYSAPVSVASVQQRRYLPDKVAVSESRSFVKFLFATARTTSSGLLEQYKEPSHSKPHIPTVGYEIRSNMRAVSSYFGLSSKFDLFVSAI